MVSTISTKTFSHEGMEYLHKITEIGKEHALKRFFNCDSAIKDEIIAKTFLVSELKKIQDFSIKEKQGNIILVRTVTIKVRGMKNKAGRIVERKKKVETAPICLEKFKIEGTKIFFSMKFNPFENNPEELAKRVEFYHAEGLEVHKISSDSRMISFEKWDSIINSIIAKIEKRNYSKDDILRMFFNTLKSNDLCEIRGDDVVNYCKIYENANIYYPEFKKLSFNEKMVIFNEASNKTIKSGDDYSLAVNIIKIFIKKGIIKKVRAKNPHSKRTHILVLKKLHFREEILRWVEYEDILYGEKKKISRGIETRNLWNLLIDPSSVQLISDKTSNR